MGGRFPSLAVFGLPALTVAIALFVLWGLRPWEDGAEPHEAPLGIEMAVSGGKALPAPSATGVAAGVAVPVGPGVQVAQRAVGDAGSSPRNSGSNSNGSPATVVAPGKAIAVAEAPSSPPPAAPESAGGEEVSSVEATPGEAPPEGTSAPVATPAGTGGGAPKAPVTAGAKPPVLPSCEGDEYVIAVTFLGEGSTVEEAPTEIVLRRLNDDGTSDELELEGDLSDARALAATLEAEGNCVSVEIASPVEEGAEEEAEVPAAESPVPSSP